MKLVPSRPDRWLVWLIAASLVLPPTYFGLVAYQSRAATLVAADQQLLGTVRLLREHAVRVLDTDRLAIRQVDQLAAGLSWDEIARSGTLHRELRRIDEQLSEVHGIFLVAPDGTVVANNREFPAPPRSVADRHYFSALRDGHPGTYISKVYRGRASGNEQFNVARRRSSPDGRFNGIIVISDSPAYFEAAYGSIGSDLAAVVLVRDDGEELASYPASMPAGSLAPAELIARLPQKEALLVDQLRSPHDGIDRRGAFQRLDGYPVFVGYSVPNASITAGWRRTVVLNGALVGLGSLTVALMGWLVLRGFRGETAAHARFRAEVQRREQAEERMEQARRMEVIGQLTAGAAHDFSNLLAIVSGNVERLRDRVPEDAKSKVDAALSATERGANLIRQMLTFARRQVLDPEKFDINAELQAFSPLLVSGMHKTIDVDYRLSSTALICRIDRAEFEFAILNIATNARHAMPRGGHLRITTASVQATGNGTDDGTLIPGRYASIAFTDSGEGMPPDILARAFEPFFTTREAGTGTGLGLSQVYGFARQSGGLATVHSVVGRGTTVTMYLPMLEAEDAAPAEHGLTLHGPTPGVANGAREAVQQP
jgi:two-component system, NtrC family, sensor kinase